MTKLLEEAIELVKALPEPDQDIVAELLLGFADSKKQRYRLTDEQVQRIEIARQEARQGRFVTDAEVESLWRRFGL